MTAPKKISPSLSFPIHQLLILEDVRQKRRTEAEVTVKESRETAEPLKTFPTVIYKSDFEILLVPARHLSAYSLS